MPRVGWQTHQGTFDGDGCGSGWQVLHRDAILLAHLARAKARCENSIFRKRVGACCGSDGVLLWPASQHVLLLPAFWICPADGDTTRDYGMR